MPEVDLLPDTMAHSEDGSGVQTFGHRADELLGTGIASMTKIMTIWVARKWLSTDPDLDQTYTVSTTGGGPRIFDGDVISLRDLMYAAAVPSDNIAPVQLGTAVGEMIRAAESSTGNFITRFRQEMAAEAAAFGYTGALFPGTVGDAVMSARQVADLFRRSMADPVLRAMYSAFSHTLEVVGGPNPRSVPVEHTINASPVGLPGLVGSKTGTFGGRGHVVVMWDHPSTGEHVSVIMNTVSANAGERYTELRKVMDATRGAPGMITLTNLIPNPRGRTTPTPVDGDPRGAVEAAVSAYAPGSPVVWSESEPPNTDAIWLHPETGVAQEWVEGQTFAQNLIPNPRGRTTSGTVVVVPDFEGSESPDPDLELVGGNLVAPAPVGYDGLHRGVLYYSQTRDYLALRKTDTLQSTVTITGESVSGTRTTLTVVEIAETTWLGNGYTSGSPPLGYAELPAGEHVIRTVQESGSACRVLSDGNASQRIPIDTTVYFRTMLVDEEYEGDWFDGDSPGWEWDGTPHESTSHRPAIEEGWQPITDPAVVAAGEAYASIEPPTGWTGAGIYYSTPHDAVFIPAGVAAVPPGSLSGPGTLAVLDVDAETTTHSSTSGDLTIPAVGADRYVRALAVSGAYDGPVWDGDTPDRSDGYEAIAYAWTGPAHASTSTQTTSPVSGISVEPGFQHVPFVGITVDGLDPADPSVVTISRSVAGEARQVVQGLREVTVSEAGFFEDWGAPLGRPVTYHLEVVSGNVEPARLSDTITLESDVCWLQDPVNPLTGIPLSMTGHRDGLTILTNAAFKTLTRELPGESVAVIGGSVPVGLGGTRQAASRVPLSMVTTAAAQATRLRTLLQTAYPLMLRTTPRVDQLPATCYLHVDGPEEPVTTHFGGVLTRWELVGDVVRGPAVSVLIPRWTYDDVKALYSTYGETIDGRRYVDWQRDPSDLGGLEGGGLLSASSDA